MTPINEDQVHMTAQIVLDYLGDPVNNTPNDKLEGIISGKSLLRGILSGNLVICQRDQASAPAPVVAPIAKVPLDDDIVVDADEEVAA